MPGTGAHLARNARSASPESVLTLLRNGCSPWPGIGAQDRPVHAQPAVGDPIYPIRHVCPPAPRQSDHPSQKEMHILSRRPMCGAPYCSRSRYVRCLPFPQ
jgi:hypothetical protein